MSALVIGASGLVGSAILRALPSGAVGTYRTRHAPGLRHLDARDEAAVLAIVREVSADVVFFPAAEPNVDWCEEHPEGAWCANVGPAMNALAAARRAGAHFVFFSSDYVFDGSDGPYGEDDAPTPISVYGKQKREVEERVLEAGGTVVRTTNVFGTEPPPGKNFVLRVLEDLSRDERIAVPCDQVSTPTWSDDLAVAATAVAREAGLWHVAGPQLLARDAFARLVAEVFGLDGSLVSSVPTAALGQRAPRPLRGGLRTDKLSQRLGHELTPVREALVRLRGQLSA